MTKLGKFLAYFSFLLVFTIMIAGIIVQRAYRGNLEDPYVEETLSYIDVFKNNTDANHAVTKKLYNGLSITGRIFQNTEKGAMFQAFLEDKLPTFNSFIHDENNAKGVEILTTFIVEVQKKIHRIFEYDTNTDKQDTFVFTKHFNHEAINDLQNCTYPEMVRSVFLETSYKFKQLIEEMENEKTMFDRLLEKNLAGFSEIILQRIFFEAAHLEVLTGLIVLEDENSQMFEKHLVEHIITIFNNFYSGKFNFAHLKEIRFDRAQNVLSIKFLDEIPNKLHCTN